MISLRGGTSRGADPAATLADTLATLRGRFESAGHKTVVWHSHLSDGERFDGWTALASR